VPDEAGAFYKAAAQQTDFGAHSQRPELVHVVKVAGTVVTATSGWQPSVAAARDTNETRLRELWFLLQSLF
jgi:hypothetical protein